MPESEPAMPAAPEPKPAAPAPPEPGSWDLLEQPGPVLLAAHVANICSERTVIWQRYMCFMTANSILIAALAFTLQAGGLLAVALKLLVPVLGFSLCIAWFFVNKRGWRLYGNYTNASYKLKVPRHRAPYDVHALNISGGKELPDYLLYDSIYTGAQFGPWSFGAVHVVVFLSVLLGWTNLPQVLGFK